MLCQRSRKSVKCKQEIEDFILGYSGEDRDKRDIGMLIYKWYKQHIKEEWYISDRIQQIILNINVWRNYWIIVFTPDINKKGKTRSILRRTTRCSWTAWSHRKIIILGNPNSGTTYWGITKIQWGLNERKLWHAKYFCLVNNMLLDNSFVEHHGKLKYIMQNTRDELSVIVYMIINKAIFWQTTPKPKCHYVYRFKSNH